MSFLNPVSEPVLRFSSTDANAPQINYNARVAGDVKEVLKACLVTGYGAKASAGWSIVNEVDHVAEFVSPSVAMSDYRLGIDDTSTSSTTWYYQYQNVRTNPSYNSTVKQLPAANLTHADNGWQLLVTARGLIFIDLVQHSVVNKLSARITYWGAVKSAIPSVNGNNICFFNIGQGGAITPNSYFYSSDAHVHVRLESYTRAFISSATSNVLMGSNLALDVSNVDLVGAIYLTNDADKLLIAELPPVLSKIVNAKNDMYGVNDAVIGGRAVLSVCAGGGYANTNAYPYARTFLIYLDHWEY